MITRSIFMGVCVCLAAGCGGEAFSSLAPAPATDGGGLVDESAGEAAALPPRDEDAAPAAGDAQTPPAPERDSSAPPPAADAGAEGQAMEPDAADADAGELGPDAGEGEAEAGPVACTSAAACPRCGSALQVACCTAAGFCGCSYSPGPCR